MFDRFTDQAKKSMNLARIAAKGFNHPYIAPEHMLHGVLSVGKCRASQVLATHKVLARNMLEGLVRRIVPADSTPPEGQLPFTSDGKRALEKAMEAAAEAHHGYIGTEHLLVGLSESGSRIVSEVLSDHSLTTAMLKQSLMDPAAKPEDGPVNLAEQARALTPAQHELEVLGHAFVIALHHGDVPTAHGLRALMRKLES
jgi:ATP-dependent Clp protease ATP-binding subunit ClpC